MKGINAQVLRRIGKLEEREDLLSELVPAMDARGYDTRAVKARVNG